jgi:hypothetical protein
MSGKSSHHPNSRSIEEIEGLKASHWGLARIEEGGGRETPLNRIIESSSASQ